MSEPRLQAGKKGGRTRKVEVRSKPVLTENGEFDFERACYECRDCGATVVPFDEKLGVAGRTRTVAVDEAIVLVGVEIPFERARKHLERLAGISVSDKTILEVTEAAGREAQAILDEDVAAAKAAKLEPAGGVLDWRQEELKPLYIEPDGSMVPMRVEDRPDQAVINEEHPGTHREAKMAVIFWGADVMNVSPKRREVRHKTYVGTIGDADEFRDKLWAATVAVTGNQRFQPVDPSLALLGRRLAGRSLRDRSSAGPR